MHGYYEYAGYKQMAGFIRHTVRKGSIVIYPRWQTDVATPCPGPYDIEPCITSATHAIHGALAYLHADHSRVQPDVRRASYFGFSFGGIITADLTNRYRKLHLPKPRAIFLDDPHDGGLTGFGEPALDRLAGGHPGEREVRVPLRRRRRHLRAGQGGLLVQRRLPQARADPGAQQEPRPHAHRRAR